MSASDAEPPSGGGNHLVPVLAMVLSVAALLVSVLEVSAMRRDQHVQVWPYVLVSSGYSAEGYRITLANKGIGPARIRSVRLEYDDVPVTDLDAFIASLVDPGREFSYYVYQVRDVSRSVVSADESVALFEVPWLPKAGEPDTGPDTRTFVERWAQKGSVRVCYCSVYDDCWLATLNSGEPDEVRSCDAMN